MKATPPKRALRFLRWFCREDYLEEIEGDLVEVFEHQCGKSSTQAKWNFNWSVIKYFRPEFIKLFRQNSNSTSMFRHNLLLTIRHFKKSKVSFAINFLSLFIGLSCALLIYLWVQDEMQIDKFHGDQLVQILQNETTPNGVITESYTPGILAEVLANEFPIVDKSVSVVPYEWFEGEKLLLSDGNGKIFTSRNQFASEDYFHVFSFEMLLGDKETVLVTPNAVVITEEMALKLYGTTEVLGRSLEWLNEDFGGTYQITGIVKDLPTSSTIQFDAVFPYAVFLEEEDGLTGWNNSDPYTYLTISQSSSLNELNAALEGYMEAKSGYKDQALFGQKFSDKYLYGNYENGIPGSGRISYVKLFSLIASFILIIAIINFVNMATAEATNRMKEIGVKKAIGIHRSNLIYQFLTESLFVSFLALIASAFMLYLILPEFNSITGKQITLTLKVQPILAILFITLIMGFLAGLYPAFHLSGFSPVKALKGVVSKGKNAQNIRRGLVVFQFSISAILIFAVMVIYQQIDYIQSKNLGFEKENIIWFTSGVPATEDDLTGESIEVLLTQIKQIPGVQNATNFAQNIVGEYGTTTGLNWQGKNPEKDLLFANFSAGYDFIQTLDINVKEGRSFSREFATDHEKIIFNDAAISAMGLNNPLGKVVELWGEKREIIGVVDNFHIASLHEGILPTFIKLDVNSFASNIMVKLAPGDQKGTINQINAVYKDFFIDGMPFDFTFLDDNYQRLYENEVKTSSLSKYAAIVAILISCLGLFGFANFMVSKRLKEVGIRKVLGASRLAVIKLVTVEFNAIVIISLLIALPIGYMVVSSWLGGFVFKVSISWWQIVVGSSIILLSAWLTIAAQTLKAVHVNPVDCLKDE